MVDVVGAKFRGQASLEIPVSKFILEDLAIGDSLFHDIRGAVNFGVDSLLITSTGIHSDFFDNKNPSWKTINNSLKKLQIKPTYICNKLNF